jgi:hypothetical protein
MPSRMLLLADHNEAVHLSKLDRLEKPGVELRSKCSEVANGPLWQEPSDVSTSGLLVRDGRTRQKRACCRYQSLVLYLLVQRG